MYFDNILDEEFKTILLPFDVVQWASLLPKFTLYDNFIFFNSRRVDFMSLFGVIIPTVIFISRFLVYRFLASTFIYRTLAMIDGAIFCIGFLIIYVSNLCYKESNIRLVLNINTVFKMLKFNENNSVSKFNAVSWFAIAAVTFCQASVIVLYIMKFEGAMFLDVLLIMFMVHIEINVICASRIVSLIDSHLELWICELDRLSAASIRGKIGNDKTGDADSILSHTLHAYMRTY